jgi:hypothetical protein
MSFSTWNVRSLYRAGSLRAAARELARYEYKLDLVGLRLMGKTDNQIAHIWIDGKWHSSILNVRSFRGADCDTDHYLVVAKVRESLALSKEEVQSFDGERFNLRKINELEVRK